MNANAAAWVPSHLREFPDLAPPKNYQAIASSSSHRGVKGLGLKFKDAIGKKERGEQRESNKPDVSIPDGFVVLAPRNHRSESMGSSGSEIPIDNFDSDEDEDREDEDEDEDEDEENESLFHTKATMSVFLSRRWITIAADIAAKDRLVDSREKEKIAAAAISSGNKNSLWHQVLTSASVKQYAMYEQSVPSKEREDRIEKVTEVEKVSEESWWTAVWRGDDTKLRKYSSSGSSVKLAALSLPRLEDNKDLSAVRKSLKSEKDIGSFDAWLYKYRGTNCLQIACGLGHVGMLQVMMELSPSSVNSRDRRYKRSPMLFACSSGSHEAVKMLLRAGCDVDVSDRDKLGDSALHKAVRSNNTQLVNWIASKWSKKAINLRNKSSETPLFLATSRSMASTLIKLGANPFLLSSEGLDALCLAARDGKSELLSVLLSCNVDNTIQYASSESVRSLPSVSDKETILCQANPLQLAIKHGKLGCVQVLCTYFQQQARAAADLEAETILRPRQRTPRPAPAATANEGISVDQVTGFSPLHYAVIHGKAEIVRSLLSRKDDAVEDYLLMAEDKQGAVPLVLAAVFDQRECLEIIVEECGCRKLGLLASTYVNSRKECLLSSYIRLKDPIGLRLDRREGQDYDQLLQDTVHFITTARAPVTESFLAEIMHKHHHYCLLRRGGVDEECRFSETSEYRGMAEHLGPQGDCPLLSLAEDSYEDEDVELVCEDKTVRANKFRLSLTSPSLAAMLRFRENQEEEEGVEGNGDILRVTVELLSFEQCCTIVHYSKVCQLPHSTEANLESLLGLVPACEELLLTDSLRCELQKHLIWALHSGNAPLQLIAALRFPSVLPTLRSCAAKALLVAMGQANASESLFEDDEEAQHFGVIAFDALIRPL